MRTPFIFFLAGFLSFFSFMARLDGWDEIWYASIIDFLIIGPLWAAVAYMAFSQRSKKAITVCVAVWLASASMLSCWHVFVFNARLAARQLQCMNNFKQIGLALQQYESRYGCLPPAHVADADGKPLHSWRVLLLPFLDQDELYRQYSFDEPWNGPNNSKLHDIGIAIYRCPYDTFDWLNTSYVVVVGDDTLWPGTISGKTSDLRDGPAETILIVEVYNSEIHWMEPRDLSFTEMDFHLNGQPGKSISSGCGKCVSVLMANGNARQLNLDLEPRALRALLTVGKRENEPSNHETKEKTQ